MRKQNNRRALGEKNRVGNNIGIASLPLSTFAFAIPRKVNSSRKRVGNSVVLHFSRWPMMAVNIQTSHLFSQVCPKRSLVCSSIPNVMVDMSRVMVVHLKPSWGKRGEVGQADVQDIYGQNDSIHGVHNKSSVRSML